MNQWTNDEGVCRTAPTTPDLLTIIFKKNQLVNTKYIYFIMFSEAAKHIYKAAKKIPEKNIESISSDEIIWMTL